MNKEYTSLGLMSGTSGDGVDASLIQSDGKTRYKVIKDKYFEYDKDIFKNIHLLREKINNKSDLERHSKEILKLEKQITLFHAKVIKEFDTFNKTLRATYMPDKQLTCQKLILGRRCLSFWILVAKNNPELSFCQIKHLLMLPYLGVKRPPDHRPRTNHLL
mgnify:CR=1 FL=1